MDLNAWLPIDGDTKLDARQWRNLSLRGSNFSGMDGLPLPVLLPSEVLDKVWGLL